MTPEEKQLLERIASQVEENNGILRGIRRTQRMSLAWKVFYWVLIIGLSFGAFYFIQPYVDMIKGISSGNIDKAIDSSAYSSSGVSELLNSFGQ